MNLKNIKLSEWSQTQKITYCVILFYINIQNREIYREVCRWVVAGALGGVVDGKQCVIGMGLGWWKHLPLNNQREVVVAQYCECTECHYITHLKMAEFVIWILPHKKNKTRSSMGTPFKWRSILNWLSSLNLRDSGFRGKMQ